MGWLTKPARNGSVLALFLGVVLLGGLFAYGFSDTQNRQTHDEKATCTVQARGLVANKQLAIFVGDVHALLVLPRSAQQKAALAALPPKLRARERALFDSLDSSTAIYSMVEGKQPAGRSC